MNDNTNLLEILRDIKESASYKNVCEESFLAGRMYVMHSPLDVIYGSCGIPDYLITRRNYGATADINYQDSFLCLGTLMTFDECHNLPLFKPYTKYIVESLFIAQYKKACSNSGQWYNGYNLRLEIPWFKGNIVFPVTYIDEEIRKSIINDNGLNDDLLNYKWAMNWLDEEIDETFGSAVLITFDTSNLKGKEPIYRKEYTHGYDIRGIVKVRKDVKLPFHLAREMVKK